MITWAELQRFEGHALEIGVSSFCLVLNRQETFIGNQSSEGVRSCLLTSLKEEIFANNYTCLEDVGKEHLRKKARTSRFLE